MVQLTEVIRWFGHGCAAVLGVLAVTAVVGVGDAQASDTETSKRTQPALQVAMLGEPVRDGDLKKNRGAALETSTPDVSVPTSGGVAVILWDEPGGKPGGGTASLSGNVTVNGTVIGR